jgi:hypothetical protein
METTNCFFTDLKKLMEIHKIQNINITANITDDGKLTLGDDLIIRHYAEAEDKVNVFTLHKPTQDEYESFFREECNGYGSWL